MKRIVGLVLVCFLFTVSAAFSADSKVGFVDLQKALNFSMAGKSAKETISKKVKDYEGTIEGKKSELKKLKEELEKQAVLLSEQARAEKERDYQQKLKDFQRFTKDIQEELQRSDADYTRQILEKVLKIIGEMGEKQGYTVILEKSESSLLYADDKIDMTEAVIKAFDEQYQKEGK
ncbi:OmpH family outer membrane protein [Trichloromonas sp.]|uniref:OmpH family outer membrane protein n=1 Tax=Trichloromonas sp. TaxID=3069249 RepID=UPI003D81A4FD